MSQPTESEVLDALADYQKHILEHNKKVFAQLVHEAETAEAPAHFTSETIAEIRREFMYNQLCVSRPDNLDTNDPRRINVPRDVLERWDDLVATPELALDGATVKRGEAQRAVSREQYRAGIEAGLRKMEGEAAELQLPADFAILMDHVDSLDGPGWPLYRENGQQIRFWDGLGEMEDAVAERVWTDLDALKGKAGEKSWDVLAGWECGAGPDATCFVIYFRDQGDQQRGDWRWRYVVQLGPSIKVFDNVVELLGWYKTFNEPVLKNIDLVSGRVFD